MNPCQCTCRCPKARVRGYGVCAQCRHSQHRAIVKLARDMGVTGRIVNASGPDGIATRAEIARRKMERKANR